MHGHVLHNDPALRGEITMEVRYSTLRYTCIFMILLFFVSTLPLWTNVRADVNYELQYYDPLDDIQIVAQEGHFVTGDEWDYLDITEMTLRSETNLIKTDITMSVTVKGIIKDQDDIIYGVYITVKSDVYFLAYKEKAAIGFNLDTGASVIPRVSGVGTSTISFTVEANQIGNPPNSFDWKALAVKRSGDGNFGDIAPNKLVKITEPWSRCTVSGNLLISGITRESALTYDSVEIQIDSESSSGWGPVNDRGGWSSWDHSIDTTALGDGEHTIYVRMTDNEGSEFEDDITIIVDQTSGSDPASTDEKPNPHIGDKYVFGISEDQDDSPEMINIDISTTSEMEVTLTGEDETLNSYNCWKMDTIQNGEVLIGGIKFTMDSEGEVYLEDDNFDIVKEDSTITIDSGLTDKQTQHKVSEYSPPKVHYDFPVEVKKKWSASTTASIAIEETTSSGGHKETTSQENIDIQYQCLFSEEIYVPGGSFDTYAIRSQNNDATFYKVEYYAPLVGYPVRIETYDIDDLLIGVLVLNGYQIKDTFIQFTEEIDIGTEEDDGTIRNGDEVEFSVEVENTGKGTAKDALIVGKTRFAGSGDEWAEFDRETIKLDSLEKDSVNMKWTTNESGAFEIRFEAYSDESDVSVMDGEFNYDLELTVLKIESIGSDSFLDTNMIIIIVAIVIFLVIVIIVITKKRKEGDKEDEFKVVMVEAVESEPYEEEETEELVEVGEVMAEEAVADEEEGGEETEDRFGCPSCDASISGDEVECQECGIIFEEYLAGTIDEETIGDTTFTLDETED